MYPEKSRFQYKGYECIIKLAPNDIGFLDGCCSILKDSKPVSLCVLGPSISSEAEATFILRGNAEKRIRALIDGSHSIGL